MSGCFEAVAAKSASVDFTSTASSGYAWATRIDCALATRIPGEKEVLNFRHIQNEDLASCNKLVVMAVTALASSTGVATGTTFASSPAGGT